MKIYFEDGKLKINPCVLDKIDLVLDAMNGYSYCDHLLYELKQINYKAVVYTNVITALNNCYAWNKELRTPEIYIRNEDGEFTRIDMLTARELREGHNIMKMYISGEFGNF